MTIQEHANLKLGDRVLWVGPDDEAIAATVTDRGIGRVLLLWDDGVRASLYPVQEDLDKVALCTS